MLRKKIFYVWQKNIYYNKQVCNSGSAVEKCNDLSLEGHHDLEMNNERNHSRFLTRKKKFCQM